MIDNGRNDEKIIAIPFNDPNYNVYTDISQLPAHILRKCGISSAFIRRLRTRRLPFTRCRERMPRWKSSVNVLRVTMRVLETEKGSADPSLRQGGYLRSIRKKYGDAGELRI